MRQDVYSLIEENQDLKKFLRGQPYWYRRLMRNPQDLDKLETEAAYHFNKTIPQRINKFSDGVQMASMLLGMFQAMKYQNG
ncbi:YlbE-like family protein [Peribacillus glennii]|uniref:YlbE-like protein n=1 Tax=Peribacillus glennii TaxID=2303991 RepID=A0A372LDV2_9BACI|nr:YlbE-like family protein [Peribacillus glennii]RFU63395.1 hypothetical protein D0466_11685 [Peribacillus glennii]